MSKCSFCGAEEGEQYPLCHSCGALRYPIEKNKSAAYIKRLQKLKLTASVIAAIATPGAFVVLAVMGVNRIHAKIRNRKI